MFTKDRVAAQEDHASPKDPQAEGSEVADAAVNDVDIYSISAGVSAVEARVASCEPQDMLQCEAVDHDGGGDCGAFSIFHSCLFPYLMVTSTSLSSLEPLGLAPRSCVPLTISSLYLDSTLLVAG